jgi:hypothetical protein
VEFPVGHFPKKTRFGRSIQYLENIILVRQLLMVPATGFGVRLSRAYNLASKVTREMPTSSLATLLEERMKRNFLQFGDSGRKYILSTDPHYRSLLVSTSSCYHSSSSLKLQVIPLGFLGGNVVVVKLKSYFHLFEPNVEGGGVSSVFW